jgi:hypothetical protein
MKLPLDHYSIGEAYNPPSLLPPGVRPPLPETMDSTMLVAYRACAAKFYREHVLKRTIPVLSVHLLAGGAFASGIEAYRRAYYADGYSKETSLDIAFLAANVAWGEADPFPKHPSIANKSLDRIFAAIASYFETYPIDTDQFQPHLRADNGFPTIEFSAAVPLDPSHGFPLHPSTGEPFIWHIRSDGLGKFRNLHVFSDEKTTVSLGTTWSSKWTLRNQFLAYAWLYREMGLPYRTALVRGVGLLKTKISHAECLVHYPDHLLNAWQETAVYSMQQMVQHWEQDYWPEEFGDACTSYGNCIFTDVCLASPSRKENYLEASYMPRSWDPSIIHNRRTNLEEAFLALG